MSRARIALCGKRSRFLKEIISYNQLVVQLQHGSLCNITMPTGIEWYSHYIHDALTVSQLGDRGGVGRCELRLMQQQSRAHPAAGITAAPPSSLSAAEEHDHTSALVLDRQRFRKFHICFARRFRSSDERYRSNCWHAALQRSIISAK